MLNGFRVIAAPWMCLREQFRFPRSRKKRIRNKWRRDDRNWRTVPDRTIYQQSGVLYMHPMLVEELKRNVLSAT